MYRRLCGVDERLRTKIVGAISASSLRKLSGVQIEAAHLKAVIIVRVQLPKQVLVELKAFICVTNLNLSKTNCALEKIMCSSFAFSYLQNCSHTHQLEVLYQ